LLCTDHQQGQTTAHVARANARLLMEQIALSHPDAVFVIGGDTAFAVITELGFPRLTPIAEVVPGVPITRVEGADLLLITKAGGFGPPDVIRQVRRILEGNAR